MEKEFAIVVDYSGVYFTAGIGTATYSDDLAVGDVNLAPVGSVEGIGDPNFALSFLVQSSIFDETNDVDYPDYPLFEFSNGILSFIDFDAENGVNGVFNPNIPLGTGLLFERAFFDAELNPNDDNLVLVVASIAPVPVPAGISLMISALGMGAMIRRKRKS